MDKFYANLLGIADLHPGRVSLSDRMKEHRDEAPSESAEYE
jgi:hypothetical protein